MNNNPPTHRTYPKCHSFTIGILWRVHGVGGGKVGGWRVHGVDGCVVVWVVVGWVVGEFMGG